MTRKFDNKKLLFALRLARETAVLHKKDRPVHNTRNSTALGRVRALPLLTGLLVLASPLWAQTDLGPVTVGAGIQTSYGHTQPDGGSSTDQFMLNSARIYISGSVTDSIKFMFNTEYSQSSNNVGILDAVAQFQESPEFNIWFGRFLPPSDRANLYGPYYSNEWAVYTDGIQDGYPFVYNGRDNGIMYWGQFAKKVKVSAGAFDGKSATGDPKVLMAARVQIDFQRRRSAS